MKIILSYLNNIQEIIIKYRVNYTIYMYIYMDSKRLGGGRYAEMEGWELACDQELDIEGRGEMNARGIVLRAELQEDGGIPIRVG